MSKNLGTNACTFFWQLLLFSVDANLNPSCIMLQRQMTCALFSSIATPIQATCWSLSINGIPSKVDKPGCRPTLNTTIRIFAPAWMHYPQLITCFTLTSLFQKITGLSGHLQSEKLVFLNHRISLFTITGFCGPL